MDSNKIYTLKDIEILIATMNRTSLDFLDDIFSQTPIDQYHLVIINQSITNKKIEDKRPQIQIINTSEIGLSKSRNLAIKNATKEICVILDDDVVLYENFGESILEAYNYYKKADIISFQTLTTEGNPYWKYPIKTQLHNQFIRKNTLSPEITFKRSSLIKHTLKFDERFGLGSVFSDGENYIFLKEAQKRNMICFFYPKYIGIHEPFSSSDQIASDRLMYARSAMYYHLYKQMAYIWIFKYVVFLIRKQYISPREFFNKCKIGINAIKKLNQLSILI